MIVLKVWSDHKYGTTDEWIAQQLQDRTYDFYLLNNIDIPWTPDPQREHPKLREHFLKVYRSYLEDHDLPFALVSGIEGDRKKCAVDAIEEFFGNKKAG